MSTVRRIEARARSNPERELLTVLGPSSESGARTAKSAAKSSSAPRSRKPCKYGPRDADGYCPKRPSAARSPSKKPPCKYGPRGADGYCPKKPASTRSSARNRTRVTAKSGSSATEQATEVVLNPRATGAQKAEAVQTAASVTAQETARTTVKRALRSAKGKQAKDAIKKAAPAVLKATGVGAAAVGAVKLVGTQATARRRAEATVKKIEGAIAKNGQPPMSAETRRKLLEGYTKLEVTKLATTPLRDLK